MEYRAVGNRCAVRLRDLRLPISDEHAMSILETNGFKKIELDIITLARSRIGGSIYRRGARPSQAPAIVDCSSLMKWLYGQCGLWLPRRTIQQQAFADQVPLHLIQKGDLIFISGRIDYYYDDPAKGVGHVGIYTGHGTVIHAANRKYGVIESDFEDFVGTDKFRSAGRYFTSFDDVIIFETPRMREVETADDLRWIVLQSLSN